MEYYKKAREIMDMDATEFIGGGDAGGEIIFGITNNEEDDVVTATQMERSQGLPDKLIIIGIWHDTLVCLDTGKMNNGECPVVELNDDYSETEFLPNLPKGRGTK